MIQATCPSELMGGDIEVYIPLVLVIFKPENFVEELLADRLEGLMAQATRHHPDCTLQV